MNFQPNNPEIHVPKYRTSSDTRAYPDNSIKLVTINRRDSTYIELEKALLNFYNPSITITAIKYEQEQEHRLYRINLARTHRNLFLKKSRLDPIVNNINSRGHCTCFCVFDEDNRSNKSRSRTHHSNHNIIARLKTPALPANNFKTDISYEDLTEEPFASMDSKGVRVNGKPVYGDIDDAFYVTRSNSGFRVKIAFADITWISKLSFGDNLLKNSMRFGYNLYSGDIVHSMLGLENEKACSLLENQVRFAWVMDFNLNEDGKIDRKSLKIYRAKIKNHMQMDYDTDTSDAYTPELAECLRNVRIAARMLQEANPLIASQMFKLKAETVNSKAVAQLMMHSRHLLGQFFTEKGYPAIYRIQYLSTTKKDLERLKRVLKGFHFEAHESQLKDPLKLAKFLIRLLSSDKSKDVQAGINISDYLLGKACYSCDPVAHEIAGYEPYSEFKGLRKLIGFVNQHVMDAIVRGVSPETIAPIIKNLCSIANTKRNQIREVESQWRNLCRVRARAIQKRRRAGLKNAS